MRRKSLDFMGFLSGLLLVAAMFLPTAAIAQEPAYDFNIIRSEQLRTSLGCQPGNVECNYNALPKVLNGKEADPGAFPWVVSIGLSDASSYTGHVCGGTIVSPTYVLTAAHCFGEGALPVYFRVQSGTIKLGAYKDGKIVSRILIHPEFNKETLAADVALIEMEEAFTWDAQTAMADLQDPDAFDASGHEDPDELVIYTVTGFGSSSDNYLITDRLRYADTIPSLTTEACRRLSPGGFAEPIFRDSIVDGMICAGDTNLPSGSDSCKGDSGGGLVRASGSNVAGPWVVGIVSRGARPDGQFDCDPDQALRVGVYTKVASYYSDIMRCIENDRACIFVTLN